MHRPLARPFPPCQRHRPPRGHLPAGAFPFPGAASPPAPSPERRPGSPPHDTLASATISAIMNPGGSPLLDPPFAEELMAGRFLLLALGVLACSPAVAHAGMSRVTSVLTEMARMRLQSI